MAGAIVQFGWTDPLTGSFGAHPVLGGPLDLNDGVTFTLAASDGLRLPAPERTVALSGNARTQGERAMRAIYQHNRRVTLRLALGPMVTAAGVAAALRELLAWVTAAPGAPVALKYQPPGAASAVYLDVVAGAHNVPGDEGQWLRLQMEPVEVSLLARPGMRGERVRLQNLAWNPGFEQGSGAAVPVFADGFATLNAYAVQAGAAPALAANVMTIPNGTRVAFGSPAWGAINRWQVRFQYVASLTARFYLHYQDGANWLRVSLTNGSAVLTHMVAGSATTLASAVPALAAGNWYWLVATQFPNVANDPACVQAAISNDSGGSIGTAVVTLGPVGGVSDAAGLMGRSQFEAVGAALAIGGAYSGVHTLALFGPGGWTYEPVRSGAAATGVCSGAWEGGGQSSANTYSGGPLTSFGAARLDLPPGGTVDTCWRLYAGGAVTNAAAMPVSQPGATVGYALAARSSGLSAGAHLIATISEYDANGVFLRSGNPVDVPGGPGGWTAYQGVVTTGASTAYMDLCLRVVDTSAPGASANGTVWFDNVRVWDATATGQSTMPYCELRFPQSPAQLVVSGLLGDLPAPAALALGTQVTGWAPASVLSYALGRRGRVTAGASLASSGHGYYGTALSPTATAVLDASAHGGYYATASVTAGWQPRGFALTPGDARGVYHYLTRFWTAQAAGNLGKVNVQVATAQQSDAWYNKADSSDILSALYGPVAQPLTASAAWQVADAGQLALPPFGQGALTDAGATWLIPRPLWDDTNPGGSVCRSNWHLLLPVDGSLLVGVVNNPSNSGRTVSGYVWAYLDGLLINHAAAGDGPAWTYGVEAQSTPNPAKGAGGPGTQTSGGINVTSGADPYLTLDPALGFRTLAGGVNQLAGYIADQAGTVLPLLAEITYSPLYLEVG